MYDKLEQYFENYFILGNIKSLLEWDSRVNLPPNGGLSREKQIKYINGELKKFLESKELDDLLKNIDDSKLNKQQRKNLKLIREIKEEDGLYSKEFLDKLTAATLKCESLWREAKKKNDFSIVKDALNVLFLLVKEQSKIRGNWLGKGQYEALVDIYSRGLKLETIDRLFGELKENLPKIISKLKNKRPSKQKPVNLKEKHKFEELAKLLATEMGFDFKSGRLDKTVHPFCAGHTEDVRLTHHYNDENFISALYGVIHETGHGLYEQNLPRNCFRQPVGQACDFAAHEASSLLHEFFIGKSKCFLERINEVVSTYAEEGRDVDITKEAKKINLKNPIRIEADIITYPLHVILRYEIEKQLFDGSLTIGDLPKYWKRKHKEMFGFEIDSDSEGCLQDIHWHMGYFGYFPSYCMGLLFAAQIYYLLGFNEVQTMKDLKKKFQSLKENFYKHGSLYDFEELVELCTGSPLDTSHYYKFITEEYLI